MRGLDRLVVSRRSLRSHFRALALRYVRERERKSGSAVHRRLSVSESFYRLYIIGRFDGKASLKKCSVFAPEGTSGLTFTHYSSSDSRRQNVTPIGAKVLPFGLRVQQRRAIPHDSYRFRCLQCALPRVPIARSAMGSLTSLGDLFGVHLP